MKIKLIIICLLLFSSVLMAQKINITLPNAANKEYFFILNRGIKQDTIQQGKLSFSGTTTITIPDKYKDYVGMGALLMKDASALNLIVNHENFDVTQGGDQQYVFKNSRENEYLYSIFQGKMPDTADTTMYAPHFLDLFRYMMELNKVNQQGSINLGNKANLRLYALDHLDMERLYTSGIWYNVIDGLVKLNEGQQRFGKDMIHILKRIKSEEVFEHFATNLVTITEQYGWDDAFDEIVTYVQESGRIKVPRGQMYTAFASVKIRRGVPAPSIEGLAKPLDVWKDGETLIVFYQPDCENCKAQIAQLLKEYPRLKQRKVRVVSISADHNMKTFQEDYKLFPWKDKLCDFQGFAGKNFINYGIMGTPTFFLLDKKQKVVKRFAEISDVISYIEQDR